MRLKDLMSTRVSEIMKMNGPLDNNGIAMTSRTIIPTMREKV